MDSSRFHLFKVDLLFQSLGGKDLDKENEKSGDESKSLSSKEVRNAETLAFPFLFSNG